MSVRSFLDGKVILHSGDCREVLASLPEASVDSIVTDPPYALTAASRNGSPRNNDPETPFGRTKLGERGFMGKTWDVGDTAFAAEFWREALRVLKPGGHIVAFGGTRTYHRLACAIEDAGFEIRDCVMWVYGSGFPKSLDVSKAIDKAARGVPQGGTDPTSPNHGRYKGGCSDDNPSGRGFGAGPGQFMAECGVMDQRELVDAAREWQGWGTALKPAVEPIVLARKPLIGTVAANVQKHGTGALAIDACRVISNTKGMFVDRVLRIDRDVDDACAGSSGGIGHARKVVHERRTPNTLPERQGSFEPAGSRENLSGRWNLRREGSQGSCPTCRDLGDALAHLEREDDLASALRLLCARTHNRLSTRAGGREYGPLDNRLCECMLLLSKPDFSPCAGREFRMAIESLFDSAERLLGSWWGCTCTPSQATLTSPRRHSALLSRIRSVLKTALAEDGGAGLPWDDLVLNILAVPYVVTKSRVQEVEQMRRRSRWPANLCHDGSEEVMACFPDAPGQLRPVTGVERAHQTLNAYGDFGSTRDGFEPRSDSGSAARFFFTAKADSHDRIASKHPTVKPLDLMQWLCRLVTPKGGTVLDPFAGTGTTGEAAWREGFRAILIEREPEYQADIARRMDLAEKPSKRAAVAKTKGKIDDHGPLFSGGDPTP